MKHCRLELGVMCVGQKITRGLWIDLLAIAENMPSYRLQQCVH
jgi:hypothetical protein